MIRKIILAAIAVKTTIAMLLICGPASAQANTDKSLPSQLEQQYKLSETVLVVQKAGILSQAPGGSVLRQIKEVETTFKDGQVRPPGKIESVYAGSNPTKFQVGEKVYASKISVDAKKGKVAIALVECASCNGNNSEYRGSVAFDFPKGYLASADVGQIEDVISQVLTIDSGNTSTQQSQTAPSDPTQTSETPALTNADIVKMVQAQPSDSVIIAKIKSSSCAFDASPDALINLKRAGVSSDVLQAIVKAAELQPATSSNPEPANTKTTIARKIFESVSKSKTMISGNL